MKRLVFLVITFGGLFGSNFVADMTKGVVIDNKSKLIWQDEAYTEAEKEAENEQKEGGKVLSFDNAKKYCSSLSYGGYTGWRVPSVAEFKTLMSADIGARAVVDEMKNIGYSYSGEDSGGVFWTSNQAKIEDEGMVVNLWGLEENNSAKEVFHFVKCVKSK